MFLRGPGQDTGFMCVREWMCWPSPLTPLSDLAVTCIHQRILLVLTRSMLLTPALAAALPQEFLDDVDFRLRCDPDGFKGILS